MGKAHRHAILTLAILLACCPRAHSLDPSLDISQYAHSAWLRREAFTKGDISSIAQTPDGYLWLGTEFGLLRFDGVRAVPWQPPAGQNLPSGGIQNLLAARDGSLWIATEKGLASWKNGKLVQYPEFAGKWAYQLLEDREGTVWAGSWFPGASRLCAIRPGSVQCYGDDGSFDYMVLSLLEDHRGNLWVGTATGVWRWKPGPPKFYSMPATPNGIQGLAEDDKGAILVATGSGMIRIVDGKPEAYPLVGIGPPLKPDRLLQDRDGSLWIGTSDRGLLHLHQGKFDAFVRSDGLSADRIYALFEDREGSIWTSTAGGLDRFHDFAVPTISVNQGLSNNSAVAVLAAKDSSVWIGTSDGLNRWSNGQITVYRKQGAKSAGDAKQEKFGQSGTANARVREVTDPGLPDDAVESLFQDDLGRVWVSTPKGIARFEDGRFITVSGLPVTQTHSIAQDRKGGIWISGQETGLFHLGRGNAVEQIPWPSLGSKGTSEVLAADPLQGSLWVGSLQGGLKYFRDGKILASYTASDGLGWGGVNDLQVDHDGTLWAATDGGLSRVKNGRIATLTSRNGLPCDAVHWSTEDDAHSVWLYMACGLARIAKSDLDAWAADPKRIIPVAVFDESDGVRSHADASGYSPHVAKAVDGRLWFSPFDGVSVIDPHHLAFNKLPPPVHIEKIIADRKTWWQHLSGDAASSPQGLPALVRDLEIDYTALSFVAPEKVRFRIKLEGQDKDWRELVNVRHVEYTNLPPKHYRFRVLASNNSGVWNEVGDSLDFDIPPAWYQTNWFRLACVAAFLAMIWGIYLLRVRQLAAQFNMRLEERVAERTRIARDLHDTLLQSFQGLMLRFEIVSQIWAERPAEAKEQLDSTIDRAAKAIAEGRDAVQGLRTSTVETNNLARAVNSLGEELAADPANQTTPAFRVTVEGEPRDLHPILRDEIYRIAAEALRNSFNHAAARQVEVEIRYDNQQFRLRVRDDGKGIDPGVLSAQGREGHFGLPGMKERGKLIGGKLVIWSEVDAGTEVELRIPATAAYAKTNNRSWISEMLGKK